MMIELETSDKVCAGGRTVGWIDVYALSLYEKPMPTSERLDHDLYPAQ